MRTEQPTKYLYHVNYRGRGCAHKTSLSPPPPPPEFVTDRSKAVVMTWFSVACFGVRVSVIFHLMFVHYTFTSVLVAEWPPFGK